MSYKILFVEAWVYRVEILRIHAVLRQTEGIAKLTLSNRWGDLFMGKGIAAHLCCSFYVHSTMKLDNGLKVCYTDVRNAKFDSHKCVKTIETGEKTWKTEFRSTRRSLYQ